MAPITKNSRSRCNLIAKGTTPIEKNIIVIDEQGNKIGATYPKRAKGLIKKGRARSIDDNTICLACPPNEILEDFKMTELVIDKTTGEVIETTQEKILPEANAESYPELTIGYVLKQIENIASQTAYLNKAIDEISVISIGAPGVMGVGEKANAIAQVVKCRETTNQKLISFYEKLYDDLKPEKQDGMFSTRYKALQIIENAVEDLSLDGDQLASLLDAARHIEN